MRENTHFSSQEVFDTSESLLHWLSSDHIRCDEQYAKGEISIAEGRFKTGESLIRDFIASTLCHFAREEEVLFPAFEEATGMTEGPTSVMKIEHQQIRGLLEQLSESLDQQDSDRIFAIGETLNILIQQHNLKEENMLYPMSDEHLEDQKIELLKAMQTITPNRNHDTSHTE